MVIVGEALLLKILPGATVQDVLNQSALGLDTVLVSGNQLISHRLTSTLEELSIADGAVIQALNKISKTSGPHVKKRNRVQQQKHSTPVTLIPHNRIRHSRLRNVIYFPNRLRDEIGLLVQ